MHFFRQYVNVIDLTEKDEHSPISEDSDPEELPTISFDTTGLSTSRKDEKICPTTPKHVIRLHQRRVITSEDNEDVQGVHIRRSHVFSDALRQFSKRSFDVCKMLKVQFIGEEAIDEGGPRREFFNLLTRKIFKSSLFAGFPNQVVPAHNVQAVANSTYYTIGKMISTCIIQGGEAPACFAKAVADYLVFDRICSPVCIEDIPDYEVQECLRQVCNIMLYIYMHIHTYTCSSVIYNYITNLDSFLIKSFSHSKFFQREVVMMLY